MRLLSQRDALFLSKSTSVSRDDHIVSVLESVHEMDYNTDLFIMSHLFPSSM